MLEAIWPSLKTYENALPPSAGIASNKMIAYFVFWVCKYHLICAYCGNKHISHKTELTALSVQFPLLMIHPRKMRWLFFVKSVCAVVAAFAMLGWAVKAGGSGPVFAQSSTVAGNAKRWAWVYSINVAVSGKTTLSLNIVRRFYSVQYSISLAKLRTLLV